eukprot:CAMPEP_0203679432 /NCGR_PEP_ID=MMETSP0090-20130426/35646_1 /ASSEMBLY_ACC=CAM_ASM_001088 /TAXON_ID=426623 /ORGANISM="Chaetoceros affinis, Strain CCMP159" /LENGTH=774 /DNA_ID=CAMNT_0050547081 /DNA_START=128 /DNA_END=2449 /DNA_ORIENTATION=+
MAGLIRRASYMSMMGLSFQSYRSTNSMSSHLLLMTDHAAQSQTLTADTVADSTSSNTLQETSLRDSTEATELTQSAAGLRSKSQLDAAQSLQDSDEAAGIETKVHTDTVAADGLSAKIAVEDASYSEEFEKATSESAAAAGDTLNTESDGVATSICEFIPLVDIICDFVGGIAGVAYGSTAAKLGAESAVDYAAAAATKAQEDTDVGELEELHAEIGEEEEVAGGLRTKAEEEEALAEEEEQEAEEEEGEARVKEAAASEAAAEAEEEAAKASEEKARAEEEMEKSLQEGMRALQDAALAGVFSTLVVSFLSFRLVMAVVIPGAVAVVGFVPHVMSMSRQTSAGVGTGTALSSPGNLGRQLWSALPHRETSYFALHCMTYLSTMSLWFTSKFENLQNFDVRSRGGIIILFAVAAGCVQGFLLHAVPHFVVKMKERRKEQEQQQQHRQVESESQSYSQFWSFLPIVGGTLLKLCKTIVHLTPLFVIEITTLWLIFGQHILTFQLPSPFTPVNVSAALLIAAILYIIVFEIVHEPETSRDCNIVVNEDAETDADEVACDEQDEEEGVLQNNGKDKIKVGSKGSVVDERKKLLDHDALQYNTYSKDSPVKDEEIELIHTEGGEEEETGEKDSPPISNSQISSKDGVIVLVEEVEEQTASSSVTLGSNTCSSYREEIIVRSESETITSSGSTRSTWGNIAASIEQYISDLKLPFEILIMTCMVVLLQGCIPTLAKLLPHVVKGHKTFFLEVSAVVCLICVLLWYLIRTNNKHGHIGLW